MIQVTNLTKMFGKFKAVDNISFEINTGDIVGFLGPNGAGKTTTMRMLAGYITPNTGKIEYNEELFSSNEYGIKQKIGYMPENNPLYKDMLVCENIDLSFKLNKIPKHKRKERIDYIVKATGIEEKYYKPISELSKGYKQRVGLALALINQPEFLILDEPTEGLDPNQRTMIRNLIKDLGKDRTVIISTHVMQEVEAMCNRILIINEGQIIANGTKDEILKLKTGNDHIKLTLTGKNIENELKKINEIQNFDLQEVQNKYVVNLEVIQSSDLIYENISKLIKKNNWTIYGLETSQNSLEEIFYQLTK